jgi:hypothetical protein
MYNDNNDTNNDWDMRKLFANVSQNAWTRIRNVNSASRLSNFWDFFGVIQMTSCRARLVTMDETWLHHYDPETKQQSM